MNIEMIKTEWMQFNHKLELSQRLNEQLIQSVLKERSRSRVAKIRRDNMLLTGLMVLNLVLLAGIFLGNPFDFKYTLQYVPYVFLAVGVVMAVVVLIKSLVSLNVNMNKVSLDEFLKRTIDGYEKSRQMETWFGIFIFSAGVLTALSFLPKKLENKAFWPAIGETAIMIGITLFIYFIAFKLGAFKNRHKEGFENDLKELNELKIISSELKD